MNEKQSYSPVMKMIQAVNGDIWLATWGAGLLRYDGKSFYRFTAKEGLPGNDLLSIMQDREGNIWLGTDGAGVCRYDGKTFTHYNRENGLTDDTFICIFQDNTGIIWFGSMSGGLTSFDGKTFTQFGQNEGFCNKPVRSIIQDKSNFIWFCTSGKGVVRYDGKSFMYLTEKEGLKANTVNGMLQDRNGNLCFASGSGLSILRADYMEKLGNKSTKDGDNQTVLFRNFSPEDGFSGWGCNGAIVEDDSGTIWISSSDRLTRYFPALDVPDTMAPEIQLTGVQLFNETVPWLDLEKNRDTVLVLGNGVKVRNFEFDSIAKWYAYPENLSLAYNNNYVTFTFIGVTSKLSTKVTYKYKLEGNDENWSTFSSLIRLDAPYGNLAPGDYIFKVKAMSSEGYWSKEISYPFTIRPPWWKTWWAYAGYILLFIAAIWFVIYSAIEYQRKKIRLIVHERNRIARELHDDIGAELTRLTMMSQMLQKKPGMDAEIQQKLGKISETGKKVLGNIGEIIWTMNPQKDNLDSLAAYIRRFVTEYLENNGIDVSIDFPDDIPANEVSDEYRRNVFLVIKEAINNISKHSKATSVRLSMHIKEKLAEFEISDNGTGFSVKEKQDWGNGLQNMSQRMKDIGGNFQISSDTNQGTLIRLTFPVR
jgi:streptogramin lyase